MNLRSGRFLGTRTSDIASLATTRENGTRSIGNLESIPESSSSDSQFDTFSQVGSEMEHNVDEITEKLRKGKFTDNPFNDPEGEKDCVVSLTFQYYNTYGAEIYKDPLGRYVYKTTEYRTPFSESPMVSYQGDLYIELDGARYEVTKYPQSVDAMGVLQADATSSRASQSTMGGSNGGIFTPGEDQSRTTSEPTGPGMSPNPFIEKSFLNLEREEEGAESFRFWDWVPKNEIKVTKIFQDNGLHEIFKDSSNNFYATTKLLHTRLPVQHTLIEEQKDLETRHVDANSNHFRILEWSDIKNLSWKGKPLYGVAYPITTARPGDRAYSTETKVPTFVKLEPTISERTTGRGPLPPWSMAPTHSERDRVHMSLGTPSPFGSPMSEVETVRTSHPEAYGPRAPRRHEEEHHRKVSPSRLTKNG